MLLEIGNLTIRAVLVSLLLPFQLHAHNAVESTNKGNTSIVTSGNLKNCESVNPTAILIEGSLVPANIEIPGQATINADILFTNPLPDDLQLKLSIVKDGSFLIPCLQLPEGQIGSCTYSLCDLIKIPAMCEAILPPELGCECPLKSGSFTLPSIKLQVPEVDPIIARLMVGDYIGQAIMFSNASPDWTIGCLEFPFRLQLPSE